jgi:hypothetical protein
MAVADEDLLTGFHTAADDGDGAEPDFDTTVAHPARVWDYLLGGKDNFAADRTAGEQVLRIMPEMGLVARSGREFLARAVHFLAGEAGVRQFLDIGTGLPTADNTHEVAQRAVPESRIVYVDSDPIVRRLMQAVPSGSYLVISQASSDIMTQTVQAGAEIYNEHSAVSINLRSEQQVTRFFDGLELVSPGVTPLGQWRPGPVNVGALPWLPTYTAVGRKP